MYDLEYFSTKLTVGGYRPDSAVFKAVTDLMVAFDQHELSETDQTVVLNMFSEFGRDDLGKIPLCGDDAWEEFNYGNVKVGEYVKVKPDMYDSPEGESHNGLVGTLLRVSGRRCTVRYLGRPDISPMHHPIDNLLSIKRAIQLKTEKNQEESK